MSTEALLSDDRTSYGSAPDTSQEATSASTPTPTPTLFYAIHSASNLAAPPTPSGHLPPITLTTFPSPPSHSGLQALSTALGSHLSGYRGKCRGRGCYGNIREELEEEAGRWVDRCTGGGGEWEGCITLCMSVKEVEAMRKAAATASAASAGGGDGEDGK